MEQRGFKVVPRPSLPSSDDKVVHCFPVVSRFSPTTFLCRILLQLTTHILGIKIRLLAETSMRNTFYKVGESLLVRRELELEKQLKEKMIHSVMPPSVAQWLMSNTAEEGDEDNERMDLEAQHQLQVTFPAFRLLSRIP